MPSFFLTAREKRIIGYNAESHSAFLRFKDRLLNGEVIKVSIKRVRSPKHHRFYFSMMEALFKQNSLFIDETAMRHWIETEAGHCHVGVDANGVVHRVHKSISYESLDQDDFQKLHQKVIETIQLPHVAELLFYESNDPTETAQVILQEFE